MSDAHDTFLSDGDLERLAAWLEGWQGYADDSGDELAREVVRNGGLLLAEVNRLRRGGLDA